MRLKLWKRLADGGETFGLINISKKRRKKKSGLWTTKRLKKRKNILSDGEQVQASFHEILSSSTITDTTRDFILSLKGSYKQFGRFTPKQFRAFKNVLFEVKKKERSIREDPEAQYMNHLKINPL